MQVEIRKSGGNTCEVCGSTEKVCTSDGPIERDITRLVMDLVASAEKQLAGLFAEEKMTLEALLRSEEARLKAELSAVQKAQEDRVADLLGERAPFWRVFKRRWQSRVESEFAVIGDEMREKTARA